MIEINNIGDKAKVLMLNMHDRSQALLKEMLCDKYIVLEAYHHLEALKYMQEQPDLIAAILLDMNLPKKDVFDILTVINVKNIDKIPIIIVSDDSSSSFIKRVLELGASEVVNSMDVEVMKRRIQNLIEQYVYRHYLENLIFEQVKLIQHQVMMQDSTKQVLDMLSSMIKFQNLNGISHNHNVRFLTKCLLHQVLKVTNHYALDYDMIDMISKASAMHSFANTSLKDILMQLDKVHIDSFIQKGMLHGVQGDESADKPHLTSEKQTLAFCYDICQNLHERWDGNGYPAGLKGDDIPIWVQAVSLADVYDNLTNNRVSKVVYSNDKALDVIQDGRYGVFHPVLMNCLKEIVPLIKQDEKGCKEYIHSVKEIEKEHPFNIKKTDMQHNVDYLSEDCTNKDQFDKSNHLLNKQHHNWSNRFICDKLTKVYNQKAFKALLEEECIKGEQNVAGLFFLGLDNFKAANDILGITYGDAVLQRTASLLKTHLRNDDILARWSGDEFIIWMKGVNDKKVLYNRAHNFCHILQNTELAGSRVVKLSASIGVVRYPDDGADSKALLACAKKALRYVKQKDKGQAICYEDIV